MPLPVFNPTTEVPFTSDIDTRMDWNAAMRHFYSVRREYCNLQGEAKSNNPFIFSIVFDPLLMRYKRGERSRALYRELMTLE